MAKEKYNKTFSIRCKNWQYEAFKLKYPNVNGAIRDFMEDVINSTNSLEEKELELLELKKQYDFLGAKIKTLEREIKKEKELENNKEEIEKRIKKAIKVCIDTYKASKKTGITLEEIRRISKTQKISDTLVINELEKTEDIKIVSKIELEAKKRDYDKEKRENKYKPEVTPLFKIFDRMNKRYLMDKNKTYDPEKFLEENKDYIEIQIKNEKFDFKEFKEYFLKNHGNKKQNIFW